MVNRPFPKNFNTLTSTCVNEFSWQFLSPRTRSYDSCYGNIRIHQSSMYCHDFKHVDRMKRNEENSDDIQKWKYSGLLDPVQQVD